MESNNISRRIFFKTAAIGGSSLAFTPAIGVGRHIEPELALDGDFEISTKNKLDLSPAKWIWFPESQNIPGATLFFKKEIYISSFIKSAKCYVYAGVQYRLYVNDSLCHTEWQLIDPRWPCVSMLNIKQYFSIGYNNVILEAVCPVDNIGFHSLGVIFKLDIVYGNGRKRQVVSDNSWMTTIARGYRPVLFPHNKLKEHIDANFYHPYVNSEKEALLYKSVTLDNASDKPIILLRNANKRHNNQQNNFFLTRRVLSPYREKRIEAGNPVEAHSIKLLGNIEEQLLFDKPLQYQVLKQDDLYFNKRGSLNLTLSSGATMALTFDFKKEITGYPYFEINSPGNAELFFFFYNETENEDNPQEGLPDYIVKDTRYHTCVRYSTKKGSNKYQFFNFENVRYLQVLIYNAKGKFAINSIGINQRYYPFRYSPRIRFKDSVLSEMFAANINYARYNIQDSVIEPYTNENDYGRLFESVGFAFGDTKLFKNYIVNFSHGQTREGYFIDNWPNLSVFEELSAQMIGDFTAGPSLDVSVKYVFDCWRYYQFTGDADTLALVFPRLKKFVVWLINLSKQHSLLPVEKLGIPRVKIDENTYQEQKHKMCAFNLYVVAMLFNAFKPICKLFNDKPIEKSAMNLAVKLLHNCQRTFWSSHNKIYASNLKWVNKRKVAEHKYDDFSLALSVLYNLCPHGQTEQALQMLLNKSAQMTLCAGINSVWRMIALAENGFSENIISEWKELWGTKSIENRELQLCHNYIPLTVLYRSIIGISPLESSYKKIKIQPQPGSISYLSLNIITPSGKIYFRTQGQKNKRKLKIITPKEIQAFLVVPSNEFLGLPRDESLSNNEFIYYQLPKAKEINLLLKTV